MDQETERSRGFGFITFTCAEHASDAVRAMNGESLDGRQTDAGKSSREPEGVALGPMGMVAAAVEVVGTKAVGVAGMTVDLEVMDADVEGPETGGRSQGGYDRPSGGNYGDT